MIPNGRGGWMDGHGQGLSLVRRFSWICVAQNLPYLSGFRLCCPDFSGFIQTQPESALVWFRISPGFSGIGPFVNFRTLLDPDERQSLA